MIKNSGVLHCGRRNAEDGRPCPNTVNYPPLMPFVRVRALAQKVGWAYEGSVAGWEWLCPEHRR